MARKDNELADSLSKNPLRDEEKLKYGPWITDDFGKKITIEAHVCAAQAIKRYHDRIANDPLLEEMRDCGALDEQYTEVIKPIKETKANPGTKTPVVIPAETSSQ